MESVEFQTAMLPGVTTTNTSEMSFKNLRPAGNEAGRSGLKLLAIGKPTA